MKFAQGGTTASPRGQAMNVASSELECYVDLRIEAFGLPPR